MLLVNIYTAEVYKPFEEYIELLHDNGYAINTIEQYAGHVCRFLDFLYELKIVSTELDLALEPSKVFQLYQDYLTLGKDSDIKLICQISKNIGKSNKTSFRSIANGIEASIGLFMTLRMFEVDDNEFFENITYESKISHRELTQIARNSWLEATKRSFNPKIKSKVILISKSNRRRVFRHS